VNLNFLIAENLIKFKKKEILLQIDSVIEHFLSDDACKIRTFRLIVRHLTFRILLSITLDKIEAQNIPNAD
jgi:hypothetical protein